MEPINKQDVLIRLLKDGYISDEEFARWLDIIKPMSFFDKISMVLRGVSPKKARLRINDHFNWFYWRVIMSLDSELPPRKYPKDGFEDKLQTVKSKRGGGFWITVEGNGV